MPRQSLSILSAVVAGAAAGGTCEFKALPEVSYVWDTQCKVGAFGCFADGRNLECRYCGQEPYNPCTAGAVILDTDSSHVHDAEDGAKSCSFAVAPKTQTMWDTTCKHGDVGCYADTKHVACRFCGEGSYPPCPENDSSVGPNVQTSDSSVDPNTQTPQSCTFGAPPKTPSMWDPTCKHGDIGCNADGIHVQCRFCGEGDFVSCPGGEDRVDHCTFENLPSTNFMWDTTCENGKVGCLADGEHMECRLCGEDPYPPCPACEFELEPNIRYVWDSKCEPLTYTKGCFADAKHFQCRFCDGEGFDACGTTTSTSTTTVSSTAVVSNAATAESVPAYAHEINIPSTSLRGGEALTSASSLVKVSWTLVFTMMAMACLLV